MKRILVVFVLLTGGLCRADNPSITVRDEKLNFTVALPDGFVSAPDPLKTPAFPHNYVRDAEQPERTLFIRIRGSGVRVRQDEMTRGDVASIEKSFPGVEVTSEAWKTFKLDVGRNVSTDNSGQRWVEYAVGIPLQTEAVLLYVQGPENRDAEVKSVFKDVLGHFDGPPGWSPLDQQQTAKTKFVLRNKHLVLAAGVLLFGTYVAWRMWRRQRGRQNEPPASSTISAGNG